MTFWVLLPFGDDVAISDLRLCVDVSVAVFWVVRGGYWMLGDAWRVYIFVVNGCRGDGDGFSAFGDVGYFGRGRISLCRENGGLTFLKA